MLLCCYVHWENDDKTWKKWGSLCSNKPIWLTRKTLTSSKRSIYGYLYNVVILKLHYSVQCYGFIQLTSDQRVTCGNIDHEQSTGMYGDTSNQYRVCPEIGYPKIQWFIIIFSMKLAILGYFTMFKRAFTIWRCNNGNSLKQHSTLQVVCRWVTNDFVWFWGENTRTPVVESIISPYFNGI